MTRLTNDIESLTEMFASGIVSLLGDVVRLAFILVAMFGDRLAAGAVLDGRRRRCCSAIAALLPRLGARRVPRHPREAGAHERLPAGAHVGHEGGAGVRAGGEGRGATSTSSTSSTGRPTRARSRPTPRCTRSSRRSGSIAIAGLLWHGGSRIVAGTLTFGVRGRVHRVPGQVLRADPRPVDQVHGHAAGDGRGRARVHPARHRRSPDAPAPASRRSPSRPRRGERAGVRGR